MELHNKHDSLPKYRMSFTVGGLFYQEAVSAAALYIKSKDWAKVWEEILKTNLFQARTINSLERICREVLSRLKLLSPEQLKIIQDGSRQEQLQILWIAVCKRYRFIRDFAIENISISTSASQREKTKALKTIVKILLELQRMGVQIFIATYDYVLLKEFDLQAMKPDKILFHSLSKNDQTEEIEIRSTPNYLEINPNSIDDAYANLIDEEISKSMGGLGK